MESQVGREVTVQVEEVKIKTRQNEDIRWYVTLPRMAEVCKREGVGVFYGRECQCRCFQLPFWQTSWSFSFPIRLLNLRLKTPSLPTSGSVFCMFSGLFKIRPWFETVGRRGCLTRKDGALESISGQFVCLVVCQYNQLFKPLWEPLRAFESLWEPLRAPLRTPDKV